MMPFAVLGVTKVASEHGVWAAQVAKQMLAGRSPGDFPVTRNRQVRSWLNQGLARQIGFRPDSAFLQQAQLVNP